MITAVFQDFPVSPDLEAAAQRARAQADGTALAPPDAARREAADLEIAALARRMRTQEATLLKAASLRQAEQAFPGKAFQLKYFKCTQIDCNDILRVSVCEASLRNTSV